MKLIDPATGQAVWDSNDPNAGPVPPAPEGRQWVRVDEPGDTMAPRRTAPGILDIGNGVTERLAFLNQTFNPVEGIGSAMRAGSRMVAPDQSYWDRIAALGEMVSGVASIAAPIAAAKAIGVPAASAMMEGLLGFSPARQAAGDMATQFARSESGALPGGGPGRPPLTFDEVARAMQEAPPVNLGQFRQERARQDLISKVKGAIEDVSSGAYQARLDENAFELHKSGNLPLRVGTRVSPPSTYEMGSDLRVSGYWVDPQNPNIFGYKLQNEAGQEFTEFVSNPKLGLVPTAADRFGGGFKAFAGPNADQRLGFKAPETPTAAARPSSSPEIDAEFEALFGAGTERAPLDVSRRDASSIFGEGSERVRYTDPQSGGTIEVVVRPDGSASVLELEVPEASRGKGIGQTLQERVMQDFPMMGGQVSSKAAATTAYRLGRRPPGKPDATLEEVFANIDEMSSVNMVSPAMQERLAPAAPVDTSYRMQQQPRGPQDDLPIRLDDLTKSTTGEQAGYPADFYSANGPRFYAPGPQFSGDEFGQANRESYKAIMAVRGKPDAEVTIYRAVPNDPNITTINEGDFVTLSPTYAKLHGASGYGRSGDEPGKIISQKVKVRDIYFDGNDVNEFGFFPVTPTSGAR